MLPSARPYDQYFKICWSFSWVNQQSLKQTLHYSKHPQGTSGGGGRPCVKHLCLTTESQTSPIFTKTSPNGWNKFHTISLYFHLQKIYESRCLDFLVCRKILVFNVYLFSGAVRLIKKTLTKLPRDSCCCGIWLSRTLRQSPTVTPMTQWVRARGLQALQPEDLPWTLNSHIFFFDKVLSIIFFICKLNILIAPLLDWLWRTSGKVLVKYLWKQWTYTKQSTIDSINNGTRISDRNSVIIWGGHFLASTSLIKTQKLCNRYRMFPVLWMVPLDGPLPNQYSSK